MFACAHGLRSLSRPRCLESSILRLLDVASDAAPPEIKSGYRRKALQLHPDVNPAEDAAKRFTELSVAYGVYQHVAEPSSDIISQRSS